MHKPRIILTTVLLVLALGILTPQFAQKPSPDAEKAELQKRQALGIGLVRLINTDEVTERSTYGAYASWEILLAHQQEYFNRFLARNYPQETGFGAMPEILPGFTLRLNVHADGKGYDFKLEDTTTRHWAAFSDETGVIWVSEPIYLSERRGTPPNN